MAIITDPTDKALLDRARAGEFAGFEALVERYERRVYSVAMNILRHREDAEDVTQTVFLSAFEHLDGFREESSFATWINRIAVNTSLKALRKRKGAKLVPTGQGGDASEEGAVPHPQFIAPWGDDPAQVVSRREMRRILDQAIDELPEKHRLVFILRDVEEFSIRDTAQALEISEANVKVRLLRARLALRERLTRLFGDEARRVEHAHHEGPPATPAEQLLRSYQSVERVPR